MVLKENELNGEPTFPTEMLLKIVGKGLGIPQDVGADFPFRTKVSDKQLFAFLRWHRFGQHFLRGMDERAGAFRQSSFRDALKKEVGLGVQQNLFLSQNLIILCGALAHAEIPHVVLKGIPLSVEAFGDPGIRMCRDIDILISPKFHEQTAKVLANLGMVLEGKCREVPFSARRHYSYSEIWFGQGWLLDLHWGFSSQGQPFGVLVETALSQRRYIQVFEKEVPVLDWDTQFLYLIHHAAKHLWLRFFWISDVYALGRRLEQAEWERLADRAAGLGISRQFWFSLKLVSEVFGWTLPLSIPPALHRFIEKTYQDWEILAFADTDYTRKRILEIPPQRVLVWSLKLSDRWITRASLLAGWVFKPSASDITTLKLPRGFWWLYPIWRVIRLLIRSTIFSGKNRK